jgi:hypothetical protein
MCEVFVIGGAVSLVLDLLMVKADIRAFSSEVEIGSREENASNKGVQPPFRFNRTFLPIALLQTPAKYDLIAAAQPSRKITGKATP